jgi:hypothetical protein
VRRLRGGRFSTASHRRNGRVYRYYRCINRDKLGAGVCAARALPAGAIESFVLERLRDSAGENGYERRSGLDGDNDWIRQTLSRFDDVWEELTVINRQRLVRAMVDEVVVDDANQEVTIRLSGDNGRTVSGGGFR